MRLGSAALVSCAFWIGPVAAQQATPAPADQPGLMPEVVVTATGRPEEVTKIAGTIQVIDGAKIEKSSAKSVTDLLAENSVGFLSEWTAGQTSLNIRGAATEGQGRDFKSEVLVLINGHRAGTANISKLSVADVEQIEIVRGPSSVVYGSQNMGGVVNIILKTGRTAPGTLIEASTGSWNSRAGKGADRRPVQGVRLVPRHRRRYAPGLSGGRRRLRDQHRLHARRRHGRARLADRRRQSHRSDGPHRWRLQHRLPRLEFEHLRLRHALQPVDRLHL